MLREQERASARPTLQDDVGPLIFDLVLNSGRFSERSTPAPKLFSVRPTIKFVCQDVRRPALNNRATQKSGFVCHQLIRAAHDQIKVVAAHVITWIPGRRDVVPRIRL